MQEVYAGDSYLSHSDWRLHFGLGSVKTVDEIEIKWSGGKVVKKLQVTSNQVLKIVE